PYSTPEFAPEQDYPNSISTIPSADVVTATPPTVTAADLAAPSLSGQGVAMQYCERGRKSLALKDYAQARSAYKVAIEWCPQLAVTHSGMAQVCYDVQDYSGALTALTAAIEADPTPVNFYYQRALVNKILKNYDRVLVDCQKILAHDPNHSSASWLNAVALVKTEKYQTAVPNLDRHIQTHPQDPNGYYYRGVCYERLEKFPQALLDLDRAIELQPKHPIFHHARGRTRRKSGDLPGALIDFNITIDRKPEAIVYEERSEIYRSLGDSDPALKDCTRAIELNPQLVGAYFRRGLIYAERGDIDLALQDYGNTIGLNPQHLDAYIQRSWIYFRQNNYNLAQADCQVVQSLDSTCFWPNYIIGVIASISGLKREAIDSLTKAIDISANYVSARYHRGIVYHQLGDITNAMADFEQARLLQSRGLERLVDRDETGFYAEGIALQHLGQPSTARKVLLFGALAAKRFNNNSFHQLIQAQIESLGLHSGDLSQNPLN
ncbi:MAG: tetratricopeptide repeat protein, partial [Chamaesiphon sp.]|nr:tetratricopeptide repeat protein [Chamaesiphon sp.]